MLNHVRIGRHILWLIIWLRFKGTFSTIRPYHTSNCNLVRVYISEKVLKIDLENATLYVKAKSDGSISSHCVHVRLIHFIYSKLTSNAEYDTRK